MGLKRRRQVAKLRKGSMKKLGEEIVVAEMLFDLFSDELQLAGMSGVVDAEMLGREAAECFVVGVVDTLVESKDHRVSLPRLGELAWDGDSVSFSPEFQLKHDVDASDLRLAGYLEDKIYKEYKIDKHKVDISHSPKYIKDSPDPYPGLELLGRICSEVLSIILPENMEADEIVCTLLQVICLGVHDCICCGAGIELESVGTFEPTLGFSPDEILKESIRRTASPGLADNADPSVTFTTLRVG